MTLPFSAPFSHLAPELGTIKQVGKRLPVNEEKINVSNKTEVRTHHQVCFARVIVAEKEFPTISLCIGPFLSYFGTPALCPSRKCEETLAIHCDMLARQFLKIKLLAFSTAQISQGMHSGYHLAQFCRMVSFC